MCEEAAVDRRFINAACLMFIWLSSNLLIETRGESEAPEGEYERPFDSNPLCGRYDSDLTLLSTPIENSWAVLVGGKLSIDGSLAAGYE
jgi:hypothetical protein